MLICITNTVDCMGRDAIRLSVKITGQVLNSNFSFQEEIGCAVLEAWMLFSRSIVSGKWLIKVFSVCE